MGDGRLVNSKRQPSLYGIVQSRKPAYIQLAPMIRGEADYVAKKLASRDPWSLYRARKLPKRYQKRRG